MALPNQVGPGRPFLATAYGSLDWWRWRGRETYTERERCTYIHFRVPKSLGWRGFKIFFLWFIYDLNTISIYDFFMGSNCGYDFFMVWICFFYDFLMVFLVLRIWFSAKNSRSFRFFYDFARVSFSPKPFQQKIWFWKQNRKKIVNASKVPRIWFSAKNSRNFRFFYDFARVSLGKS